MNKPGPILLSVKEVGAKTLQDAGFQRVDMVTLNTEQFLDYVKYIDKLDGA